MTPDSLRHCWLQYYDVPWLSLRDALWLDLDPSSRPSHTMRRQAFQATQQPAQRHLTVAAAQPLHGSSGGTGGTQRQEQGQGQPASDGKTATQSHLPAASARCQHEQGSVLWGVRQGQHETQPQVGHQTVPERCDEDQIDSSWGPGPGWESEAGLAGGAAASRGLQQAQSAPHNGWHSVFYVDGATGQSSLTPRGHRCVHATPITLLVLHIALSVVLCNPWRTQPGA